MIDKKRPPVDAIPTIQEVESFAAREGSWGVSIRGQSLRVENAGTREQPRFIYQHDGNVVPRDVAIYVLTTMW